MNRDGASSIVERSGAVTTAFRECRDLEVVKVPGDWHPHMSNDDVRILCSPHIGEWDDRIDGKDFPRPTNVVRAKQRVCIKFYEPNDPTSPTLYEDGLELLARQRALLLGVASFAIIVREKLSKLQEDDILTVLDTPTRLFEVPEGGKRVGQIPYMSVGKGKLDVGLQSVRDTWAPRQMLVAVTQFQR